MRKLGEDLDSKVYWEKKGNYYSSTMEDPYHMHRLGVIRALIPSDLYAFGRRIYDFGCGDATLFLDFLQVGACIEGVDISQAMIKLAR